MRLLAARLHPFGRFQDTTWDLATPVAVVSGPNEAGKSTLRQAICHALFTPSGLTPARLRDTLACWFPLPGGDHASVTLEFDHGGTHYTLSKTWGAGATVSLTSATGVTLADPERIAATLADLLGHNEATFRHVLVTGHDELERTLAALEANASALRDIRSLAQAGAGAAGEVDQQQLELALRERLKRLFNRWDNQRQRPQRQNGQEKGVGNEWKQGVGEILAAWYAWQRLVEEQRQILAVEQDIDRVTTELAALASQNQTDEALLERFGGLRSHLAERKTLDERVPRLEAEAARLQKAFAAWPVAEAAASAWQARRTQLIDTDTKLREELSTARRREQAAGLLASHQAILKAKADHETACQAAAAQPHPDAESLAAINRLEEVVTRIETQLAARELRWQIEPTAPATVQLTRGTEPTEPLPLTTEPIEGTANGRVQLETGGLRLTVDSGGADLSALFTELQTAREELAATLTGCGMPSAAAARDQAARHAALAREASTKEQTFNALLQDRSLEQWEAAVASITTLPPTRDIATLEAELESLRQTMSRGDHEAASQRKTLEEYQAAHSTLEQLGLAVLTAQQHLREATAALAALPSLPEGFETAEAVIASLDAAQQRLNSSREPRAALAAERASLEASLGDRRSEDVSEQAEAAERTFQRVRETGRCYERIADVLGQVTAQANTNTILEAFGERVTELFSGITAETTSLDFTGTLPARITRGAVSLPPERLSQGAGGALALAVRLALAERYLGVTDGFIMLDDPLVHFDADRVSEAVALLQTFAQRHQVLFFTCHEHQATLLQTPPQIQATGSD